MQAAVCPWQAWQTQGGRRIKARSCPRSPGSGLQGLHACEPELSVGPKPRVLVSAALWLKLDAPSIHKPPLACALREVATYRWVAGGPQNGATQAHVSRLSPPSLSRSSAFRMCIWTCPNLLWRCQSPRAGGRPGRCGDGAGACGAGAGAPRGGHPAQVQPSACRAVRLPACVCVCARACMHFHACALAQAQQRGRGSSWRRYRPSRQGGSLQHAHC